MGTILHNTVPINIDGRWSWTTDDEYQSIESYPYTSLDGTTYGCISADSLWSVVGELPAGLAIDSGTGVISGTVSTILDTNLIEELIKSFPAPYTIPKATSNAIYVLGSQKHVTIRYDFDVYGWNNTIPSGPTILPCTIIVLKNFAQDVNNWRELGDDIYKIGIKDKVYY